MCTHLESDKSIVCKVITSILCDCQLYMREQEVRNYLSNLVVLFNLERM